MWDKSHIISQVSVCLIVRKLMIWSPLTSMPNRTIDLKSCFLNSAVTGGIAMENAVLSYAPRKRFPSGAVSSSGTVDPSAVL